MDEWTRAWEAATGTAAGEPQHRVERAAEAGPTVGEEFADGINPPGFSWRVEDLTGDGCVVLRMFRDGEATESVLRWPLNRWAALVEKQQLRPAVRA
jgi:hypothetical protein